MVVGNSASSVLESDHEFQSDYEKHKPCIVTDTLGISSYILIPFGHGLCTLCTKQTKTENVEPMRRSNNKGMQYNERIHLKHECPDPCYR